MSFDELMSLAKGIEESAANAEHLQLTKAAAQASQGGPAIVDLDELKKKYENCAQPHFEPFTNIPDPASYESTIDSLHDAMKKLAQTSSLQDPISGESFPANRDLDLVSESSADVLSDWTGQGADNFKTHFLDQFASVASNQFLLLGILKGATEADQEMWQKARNDIEKIAKDTQDALDNLGSKNKDDLEFGLSVVTAVVAIGSIPLSGGASAAALPAVGAAASVADSAVKGKEAIDAKGGSAEQIVHSMQNAIKKLTHRIQEEQGKISKAMHAWGDEAEDAKGKEKSAYHTPRPKLAGMEGEELTGEKGLGDHG